MRSVLRLVCLTSLQLGVTGAAAELPSAAPPRIAARELQADFAILKQAYEELHPSLYRYSSKEQMDAHFAALRAEFERDLTLQEAYLAFSVFLAKVKCGHTFLASLQFSEHHPVKLQPCHRIHHVLAGDDDG